MCGPIGCRKMNAPIVGLVFCKVDAFFLPLAGVISLETHNYLKDRVELTVTAPFS